MMKKRRKELISCRDGEGNTDSRDIDDDDESNDKNNEDDVVDGDDNGVDHVEEVLFLMIKQPFKWYKGKNIGK